MDLPWDKKRLFEASAGSPALWLGAAWKLKRAAEEIDGYDAQHHWKGFGGGRDGDKLFLLSVYRMLMGLSFDSN